MTPEEKQKYNDALHVACRKVRFAIAVLDEDVPMDEQTVARLDEAMVIIRDVRNDLVAEANA